MQTLRKKNSPCKFKKEPTRFLGEGVSFKAKLIGILEVSEARGDRMCQAALADLKMAIRAAGEHKQRIAVQVSIDGLRLRDEKTGECLYHHPVHKISFIAQDMSDSRAFGYIFGSPDTGHRFFGIKTDKAANQVVIAMRDLFQVVFELKKKEIELTKQNIEQNASKFHISGIFVEPAPDTKGAAGTESCLQRIRRASLDVDKGSSNSSVNEKKNDGQTGVIADLLDLQFELNSLQQGIHQMDKITPDNPRPSSEDPFETDPFGDSFANIKVTTSVQPILPPPPATSKRAHLERQQTMPATPSSATSSPAAQPIVSGKTSPPQESIEWIDNESEKRFSDGEIASLTNTGNADEENGSTGTGPSVRKSPQIDVFTELDPLGTGLSKPYIDKKDFFQHLKNPPKKVLKDLVTTNASETFPTNFDISLESLDPIKVRNGSAGPKLSDTFEDGDFANFEKFDETLSREVSEAAAAPPPPPVKLETSQHLNKNRSNQRMIHHQPLSVSLPPEESPVHEKPINLNNTAPTSASSTPRMDRESTEFIQSLMRLPSPKKYRSPRMTKDSEAESTSLSRLGKSIDKPFPVDFSNANESAASPLRSCTSDANSRLSSSSAELETVPEPPPRGAGSIFINPPPLPPKKQGVRGGGKPPPRPPHTDSYLHYDFIGKEESVGAVSPSPTKRERTASPTTRTEDNIQRFDDNFSPPSGHTPRRGETAGARVSSSRFETMTPTTLSTLFRNPYMSNVSSESKRVETTTNDSTIATRPSLDITLSQLTSSNLAEFATSLDMTVAELSGLTLQQLTECLSRLSARESNEPIPPRQRTTSVGIPKTSSSGTPSTTARPAVETSFVSAEPLFKADFDQAPKRPPEHPEQDQPAYDKYAVFRELLEMDQRKEDTPSSEVHDSMESDSHPESPTGHDENIPKVITEQTTEKEEAPSRRVGLLPACDLSVQLPPLDASSPKRVFESAGKPRDRSDASDDGDDDDDYDDDEERPDASRNGKSSTEQRESTIEEAEEEDASGRNSNEDYEDKALNKRDTEITFSGKKSPRAKFTRDREAESEDQGEREEEMDEDEDEEEEEEEDEDEDEEENGASKTASATKSSTKVQLATLMTDTKDRYAALREIVDDPESTVASKDANESESMPSATVASWILRRLDPQSLADQDLLKWFSEPVADTPSPRRSTRNEDDTKATNADIFEEIRMLNNSSSDATIRRQGKGAPSAVVAPTSTSGFEDVFCPFSESKASQDGRESAGSVKDESNWAKFESSAVFHSDKSSYEGAGSIGGTSPWSPDEKDFQMESGGGGVVVGGGKTAMLMKGHYQQRLHSGESDNEWKDDEESEESNGKRQFRDEAGFWCARHPRFEMPDEAGTCYDERGERSERGDKERHFRERGTRKVRGGPWPKQPSSHRTRDSSPWHEEPPRWSREEEEAAAHRGIPRGRYPPSRKQTSAPYKDEPEETSKAYWKCRGKQRAWNGEREAFRGSGQQQPQSQPTSQHFGTEPIFYEDERTKRRMILWGEEDRDRDRFSSQESMAYEDEERWSRREYNRRRERWDEEGGTEGGRFWPRRGLPSEADSRLDPRLDPRSEYGPPIGHEVCRKQHYFRGERELRSTGHELYVPGTAPAGCWPEDEYSLPPGDRPENSPRYLTRKRHWPKRPNSANDERNLSETPVYADSRLKYGMSRSECSDNDYEPSYHRPYRSRSRESYWGSDQEFESWPTGGSGSDRLYWSEGPDAKSETLHRRRINRHKTNRAPSQKSQNSPFEDDFTEPLDRNEASFDTRPEPRTGSITAADANQPPIGRNTSEHQSKELKRTGAVRGGKKPRASATRSSDYFENETIMSDRQARNEPGRDSSELKSTPEDFPSDMEKGSMSGDPTLDNNDAEARDSFFNGGPSPGFDEDAFAFKSEMADSLPESNPTAPGSSKNSRQIKYGNNKIKSDYDIKKSESVNIFVRESDPFDDDDFFK